MNTRGWFGVAVYQGKTDTNMGTLWRSAYLFGTSCIYTIGRKYKFQSSDTVDAVRHIPYCHYDTFDNFLDNVPKSARIIGVELSSNAKPLTNFCHPANAIYVLGNEVYGIHDFNLIKCHDIIYIPTLKSISLNVAVAGSIVIHDRCQKGVYKM